MKLYPDPLNKSYLIHVVVNLYASKELCSILLKNGAKVASSMRMLKYINDHIDLY